MRGFRATVDSPGCDVYRELMVLYPKAKVILSVRDNDNAWYKSFMSTLATEGTQRYYWLTLPIPMLRCQKVLYESIMKRWRQISGTSEFSPKIHSAHNKDVRSNVPREKLLVFNVKEGWEPLCKFLEVPVPDQPFPNLSVDLHPSFILCLHGDHRNDAKMISRILVGAQMMGACAWFLYLSLAGSLFYVTFWPNALQRIVRDRRAF